MPFRRFIFFLCCYILTIPGFSQIELWGVAPHGGTTGNGTIFSYDGTEIKAHYSFEAIHPGASPLYLKLLQATNGKLYGMTSVGGTYDGGVIFEYGIQTKSYRVLYQFQRNTNPNGSLIQASNGKLYGTANTELFEVDLDNQQYKVLHKFEYETGYIPGTSLVEGNNSKLFGVTMGGGMFNTGVLFEYDINTSVYSPLDHFDDALTGMYPYYGLMRASNGKFYGMTENGGMNFIGSIYEYDQSTGKVTALKSFGQNYADNEYVAGAHPYGTMVEHPNGKFYGVTHHGGSGGIGVLFEYDIATNQITPKIEFRLFAGGGIGSPAGNLTVGNDEMLYYATHYEYGIGTCFQYDVVNNKLREIPGPTKSRCTLLQASDGNLYGVSEVGEITQKGGLFRIDPHTLAYEALFSFNDAPDGASSFGHLTQAYNGKFYGMTRWGGDINGGVIFEFDPVTKAYVKKCDIGYPGHPRSGFILHPNGKLYGAMNPDEYGLIIEFDPDLGVITHKFDFTQIDYGGWGISGELLLAPNGKMYGLTFAGGTDNKGTLFEYDPVNHTVIKKNEFGDDLGSFPLGSLTLAPDGKLYGVASQGGTGTFGTLFEYDIAANELTKRGDFTASIGVNPEGPLTVVGDVLYGTSYDAGGPAGIGTLYGYNIKTKTLETKYTFGMTPEMSIGGPVSNFIRLQDGMLYGFILAGHGAIVKYDPTANTAVILQAFNGMDGARPEYNSLVVKKATQTITRNIASITKTYGDEPVDLSTVASASSGLEVQYWSSDPSVADVVNGKMIIKKAGTITIYASQLGNEVLLPARSEEIHVTILEAIVTGVDEQPGKNVKIYPVPTTDKLHVENGIYGTSVTIMDLMGRVMVETKLRDDSTLDVSVLMPGVYVLKYGNIVVRMQKI